MRLKFLFTDSVQHSLGEPSREKNWNSSRLKNVQYSLKYKHETKIIFGIFYIRFCLHFTLGKYQLIHRIDNDITW